MIASKEARVWRKSNAVVFGTLVVMLAGSLLVSSCIQRVDRTVPAVVYGSTPAGIMAAISIAKRGHQVLLVTPDTRIGGMMSSGLSATDYWGSDYISGPVLDFFRRLGRHYGKAGPSWVHEPSVAEATFQAMLAEQPRIQLVTGAHLIRVRKDGGSIKALETTAGTLSATVFVDASYEGDVLAGAGVPFAVGRESSAQYGESLGGVRYEAKPACIYCRQPISPVGKGGHLLPMLEAAEAVPGSADGRVMDYNFRLCLTDRPENRRAIPEPRDYDPARFEYFARAAAQLPHASVSDQIKSSSQYLPRRQIRSAYFNLTALPNGKYDMNSGSVFMLQLPNGGGDWPEGDARERREIYDRYREYTLQLLKWMRTDLRVSSKVRNYLAGMGLCADEWPEEGNWPPLLYVREGRRMISGLVVTQTDIEQRRRYPDAVLAAFSPFDAKSARLVVMADGRIIQEGTIYETVPPFEIPYRSIRPETGASNLLVPVAVSASHVAYSAIRMEPIWMGLGTAAGEAAALALERNVPVQRIDTAELQIRLKEVGQKIHVDAGVPRLQMHPPAAQVAAQAEHRA